jgi:hypothetical protein
MFLLAKRLAFFPQARPKSRTNALLNATAELDDDDLEEVTLYASSERRGTGQKEGVSVCGGPLTFDRAYIRALPIGFCHLS